MSLPLMAPFACSLPKLRSSSLVEKRESWALAHAWAHCRDRAGIRYVTSSM